MPLEAPRDELLLAFEAGKNVRAGNYLLNGRFTSASALDKLLSRLPRVVRVKVDGLFSPPGVVEETLLPWGAETIGFSLNVDSLGTLLHAVARDFVESQTVRIPGVTGVTRLPDTPPEVFLQRITVERVVTEPERPPRLVERFVYRDRQTGRFVKRSTWVRSRAQLPAGKPGRFVRQRQRFIVRGTGGREGQVLL